MGRPKISSILIKIVFLVVLVGIGLVFKSIYQESEKNRQIREEITKLQEEAQKINRDNMNLQEKIAYLESSDYQKKEAKDKLNLQSPGENVVVIKQSPTKEAQEKIEEPAPTPVSVPKENLSNAQKWWNYFFKY